MLRDIYGDVRDGRIGRGRFVPWSLVLAGVYVLGGIALGFLAGLAETLGLLPPGSGSRQAAGGLALVAFLAVGLAMALGLLNLAAKRARDIGWPALVGAVLVAVLPGLGWLILALVPGKTQPGR